jgi:hypothetical protein
MDVSCGGRFGARRIIFILYSVNKLEKNISNVIIIQIVIKSAHSEPDEVLIFEIKIDSAFETFSVMSTIVPSNYHEVITVRVLQVTGEG